MRQETDLLVVHCSATPPSMNIGVAAIDHWHREQGWLGIGYHYVIRRDGTLQTGRPADAVGAHAKGYNHRSIGVCLVGGVDEDMEPEDNFKPAQINALRELIQLQKIMYGDLKVVGHNDLSAKACPSFDVSRRLADTK